MAVGPIALPSGRRSAPWSALGARLTGLPYKWQVVLCTVVGTFMVMLDSTIVNTALPKITVVFGVTVHEAQLIITGYMLALAVIMPATGYLSDTFGTKRLYLITMFLFTAGSALCGFSWNNTSMVFFRVIQGLGGGMMSPLGMTMLFKAVPVKERNAMMGIYGLPLMAAPVLGPTLGGYIVEYIDWRVIFTLNVPIGALGILLGMTLLRESERVKGLKLDVWGFVLSAVGFSALLLGLSDASEYGWGDSIVLARIVGGLICLAIWVWVEVRHPQPLMDLRLFESATFSLATVITFVLMIGLFGSMILIPIFLQSYRGLGAAESGVIMISQTLAMTASMPIVGRLADRFGVRSILLVGLPLVAITTWQFVTLDLNTSDAQIRWMLATRGLALGIVMMPAMTAAMNAAPMHLMSRASSLTNVTRQVFGSFGTAIFVSFLQSRQIYHQAMLQQTVTAQSPQIQSLLAQAQQWAVHSGGTVAQGKALAVMALYKSVALTSAVMALDDTFRAAAVLVLLGMIPAAFLRTRSHGARRAGEMMLD